MRLHPQSIRQIRHHNVEQRASMETIKLLILRLKFKFAAYFDRHRHRKECATTNLNLSPAEGNVASRQWSLLFVATARTMAVALRHTLLAQFGVYVFTC